MPEITEYNSSSDWGTKAYVRIQPTPKEVSKKIKQHLDIAVVSTPRTKLRPNRNPCPVPIHVSKRKLQQPPSFNRGNRVRYVASSRSCTRYG